MPYVFYEELPEGAQGADVVAQEDYDALASELDASRAAESEALGRLEEAVARAVEAERARDESRRKYADAFFDKARGGEHSGDMPPAPSVVGSSITDLFM